MAILSWYDDKKDTKLFEYIQPLKLMSNVYDVRPVIQNSTSPDNIFDCTEAILFSEMLLKEMKKKEEQDQRARLS